MKKRKYTQENGDTLYDQWSYIFNQIKSMSTDAGEVVDVKPVDVMVYFYLYHFQRRSGKGVYESQEAMAEKLGLSRSTLKRAIATLRAIGVCKVKRGQGYGKTNFKTNENEVVSMLEFVSKIVEIYDQEAMWEVEDYKHFLEKTQKKKVDNIQNAKQNTNYRQCVNNLEEPF